jgi:hypothetical protein
MVRQFINAPPNQEAEAAKEKFAAINTYVAEHGGGWLVSVPGDPEMRLQVLPGSVLLDQLAALGYIVEKTGETQRTSRTRVAPKFEVSSSGALAWPTEGSTKPTSVVVTNAWITTVE